MYLKLLIVEIETKIIIISFDTREQRVEFFLIFEKTKYKISLLKQIFYFSWPKILRYRREIYCEFYSIAYI